MTFEQWANGVCDDIARVVKADFRRDEVVRLIVRALQDVVVTNQNHWAATAPARFHANAMLPGTWESEALAAAVEAEREMCAQAAESAMSDEGTDDPHQALRWAATAIRERGETVP